MSDQEPELIELSETYHAELARLEKMVRIMYSMTHVRHFYYRLSQAEVEITNEFMMDVEAYTTALIISYGRIFTETEGVTKLSADSVPANLKDIHSQIMNLRHSRYAHHGDHDSIKTELSLVKANDVIVVAPRGRYYPSKNRRLFYFDKKRGGL
ncbi:MAG TPA: hypothetical protein VFS88_07730 [Micavibrio sp.]|nr:hypothetical protein [Micavibrio sp.]